jgi:hypothetical protein
MTIMTAELNNLDEYKLSSINSGRYLLLLKEESTEIKVVLTKDDLTFLRDDIIDYIGDGQT